MENILKILITLAFLSLLVDAAVSTPASPEARSSFGPAITKIASKVLKFKNQEEFKKIFDKAKSQAPAITKNKNIQQAVRDWFRKVQQSRMPGRLSAFDDCFVMTVDTIDQIKTSKEILNGVKLSADGVSSLTATQRLQLYNLLSAAQTNVLTCLEGFSHSRADKRVQADIVKADLMALHRSAGFLLSITDGLTNEKEKKVVKEVKRKRTGDQWPDWLSADDRKLLQEEEVKADVTVAADGSGDYRTVAEAVAAAPEGSSKRYVIRIKAGKYMENVEIPKEKTNLTFVGDGLENTFIIASKNVVDGNTTFNSATVGQFSCHTNNEI